MFVYFVSFTGGFPSPCYASRGMTSLFLSFPWEIPIATLRVSGNDVGVCFLFLRIFILSCYTKLPYAVRQILHLHLFVRDYKLSKYLSNSEILCLASAEPLAAALVQASRALA